MVSESKLADRLLELVRDCDLTTTTTATLRRQLEQEFGINLSDKKAFIREKVDLFLRGDYQGNDAQNAEEVQQHHEKGGDGKKEEQHEGKVVEENDDKEEEEELDGDDDDDDDDDGKRGFKKSDKKVKRKNGFTKLCSLSPQLQDFVGAPEMARTEVVKQMWVYIREKNLQDPSNRRNIICDDKLKVLFKVNVINMFQMNKALTKHIWPREADEAMSTPKEKQHKQETEDSDDEPIPKRKRQKVDTDAEAKKGKPQKGILAPVQLSDALVKFLGTGESALTRSNTVKRMWDYIKQNNLQDPSDRRRILCDEKLKELFDVETFNGFSVTKLLSSHFVKTP